MDADQIRTERPVESEQSICLFTQREEIDTDFRVSGLPHAVVKQAEDFRVRELVKKIESHPHREALQADLQQHNAYKNAPMKLRSDFRTAVTIVNRLHRESGEERPEPIPFINTNGGIHLLLPVPHGGSGMKTGGAHIFFLRKIVVARSFRVDGNLLQPTGGVNRTPSHVTFSRVCTHV